MVSKSFDYHVVKLVAVRVNLARIKVLVCDQCPCCHTTESYLGCSEHLSATLHRVR